jgi:hypothetical protein
MRLVRGGNKAGTSKDRSCLLLRQGTGQAQRSQITARVNGSSDKDNDMGHSLNDAVLDDLDRMEANIRYDMRCNVGGVSKEIQTKMNLGDIIHAYLHRGNDGLIDEFVGQLDAAIEELAIEYTDILVDGSEKWLDNVNRAADMNRERA